MIAIYRRAKAFTLLIFISNLDSVGPICYNTLAWMCGYANIAQLVEQRFRKPQVKGSSPFIGSTFRGVAQLGRALRSGRRGRWFKSVTSTIDTHNPGAGSRKGRIINPVVDGHVSHRL